MPVRSYPSSGEERPEGGMASLRVTFAMCQFIYRRTLTPEMPKQDCGDGAAYISGGTTFPVPVGRAKFLGMAYSWNITRRATSIASHETRQSRGGGVVLVTRPCFDSRRVVGPVLWDRRAICGWFLAGLVWVGLAGWWDFA